MKGTAAIFAPMKIGMFLSIWANSQVISAWRRKELISGGSGGSLLGSPESPELTTHAPFKTSAAVR